MITAQTLDRVFSSYYVINPPKNVIVLDKPTVMVHGQSVTFFRGLTPKWRSDVVIITPQGNDETLLHEAIHAQFNAGEAVARIGGKIAVLKSRWFPKQDRQVHYQQCYNCELERNLYKDLNILPPPGSNPIHYVLVSNNVQ